MPSCDVYATLSHLADWQLIVHVQQLCLSSQVGLALRDVPIKSWSDVCRVSYSSDVSPNVHAPASPAAKRPFDPSVAYDSYPVAGEDDIHCVVDAALASYSAPEERPRRWTRYGELWIGSQLPSCCSYARVR